MSDNKLNVIDLHKRYGEHEVLKGVSLQANAGDVISIIGSSGSGKSTFLRCINFLEKPSEGTIIVNGENINWCAIKTVNCGWRINSNCVCCVPA